MIAERREAKTAAGMRSTSLATEYAREADPDARRRILSALVESMRWFVMREYGWFVARNPDAATMGDDLIQEGLVGVMRAAEGYDPSRGFTFATFARPHILVKMDRYFQARHIVRVPFYHHETGDQRKGSRERLRDKVLAATRAHYELAVGEEDAAIDEGLTRIERAEDVALVRRAIERLPIRHRKVIRMRYGLGRYKVKHTLKEIGAVIGVTRERVRQIELEALGRLREAMGGAA